MRLHFTVRIPVHGPWESKTGVYRTRTRYTCVGRFENDYFHCHVAQTAARPEPFKIYLKTDDKIPVESRSRSNHWTHTTMFQSEMFRTGWARHLNDAWVSSGNQDYPPLIYSLFVLSSSSSSPPPCSVPPFLLLLLFSALLGLGHPQSSIQSLLKAIKFTSLFQPYSIKFDTD